jgi:hypothetical protein
MALPVMDFPEIARWYAAIAALPAWRRALAAKDASMAAWRATRAAGVPAARKNQR